MPRLSLMTLLVGDERKIKQALLNLLSNAVKFTPEGGRISLTAGIKDASVEIAVSDTGVGIAPGDQEAIFDGKRGDDGRQDGVFSPAGRVRLPRA